MNNEIIAHIKKTIEDAGFLSELIIPPKLTPDSISVPMIDIFVPGTTPILPRHIVGRMTFDEKLWKIWICDGGYTERIIKLHSSLIDGLKTKFKLRAEILITAPKDQLVSA